VLYLAQRSPPDEAAGVLLSVVLQLEALLLPLLPEDLQLAGGLPPLLPLLAVGAGVARQVAAALPLPPTRLASSERAVARSRERPALPSLVARSTSWPRFRSSRVTPVGVVVVGWERVSTE
jgi:hypothetical protein